MSAQAKEREPVGSLVRTPSCAIFISANSKEKLNEIDRFLLAKDVIARAPVEHALYIGQHGEDMPEIRDWKWVGDATKSLP